MNSSYSFLLKNTLLNLIKMTSVTLDYFDIDMLSELKTKWYSTQTHATDIINGNDRYVIIGVQENGSYEEAISIYPTFEAKISKWNSVLLGHRNNDSGNVIAMHFLKS